MSRRPQSPAWLRNPWGRPRFLVLATGLYLTWAILPVAVAMLFSFNDGRSRTLLDGLSLRWWSGDDYLSLIHRPDYLHAVGHSLFLALLDMAIATPLGIALAVGLGRWRGRGSRAANLLTLVPLVTPELVLATALLLLFTQVAILPYALVGLGTTAQMIGQVTVSLPYVVLIVRSRLASIGVRYEEAAADLGASPGQAMRLVLLPLLGPAGVASLLVVFALSMDNFVMTQYLSADQPTATISMYLYADTRVAGTPALNALATLATVLTLTAVGLAAGIYWLTLRRISRARRPNVEAALEPAPAPPVETRVPATTGVRAGALETVGLGKRFGETPAVVDVSLDIRPGEFFAILGPSGCGKTTLLRLIGGFERPTAGQILLDGHDVSAVPAHERKVNTVFQDYALFPHLDVYDNVAFGLRRKHTNRAEIERRVREALDLVQLGDLPRRRPASLSGGQQQRVALARALVLRPDVLLLDEPLGSLDAKLRKQLQEELAALQQRVGITFVLVTHDQEEALGLSDRIAVMRAGRIEQVGAPRTLYEEPATPFVADFLGASNLVSAQVETVDTRSCWLRIGDARLRADLRSRQSVGVVTVMVRPERIILEAYDPEPRENRIAATVLRTRFVGSTIQVNIRVSTGHTFLAEMANNGGTVFGQGAAVSATFPPDAIRILDEAMPP